MGTQCIFVGHPAFWLPPGILLGTQHVFWRASTFGKDPAFLMLASWHLGVHPALLVVAT